MIDGQQRLTTLTLLLAALANAIEKQGESKSEPVDGFSPRKIRNYYLLNPEEEGERHYKLLLTQTDKQSLISILNGSEQPHEKSLKVTQNYALFEKWIADASDLETICNGKLEREFIMQCFRRTKTRAVDERHGIVEFR